MNKTRYKILRATLNVVVLRLINKEPTYGYRIIKEIKKVYGVHLSPSVVYPLLNKLGENGCLESEWNTEERELRKPQKVYTITEKGKALLRTEKTELQIAIRPFVEVVR